MKMLYYMPCYNNDLLNGKIPLWPPLIRKKGSIKQQQQKGTTHHIIELDDYLKNNNNNLNHIQYTL